MNKMTFHKVWTAAWDTAIKDFADLLGPEDQAYADKKREERFEAWFKKAQEEEI